MIKQVILFSHGKCKGRRSRKLFACPARSSIVLVLTATIKDKQSYDRTVKRIVGLQAVYINIFKISLFRQSTFKVQRVLDWHGFSAMSICVRL